MYSIGDCTHDTLLMYATFQVLEYNIGETPFQCFTCALNIAYGGHAPVCEQEKHDINFYILCKPQPQTLAMLIMHASQCSHAGV